MAKEWQIEAVPEEAYLSALVLASRQHTNIFEVLREEVELFPTTLSILTGEIVSSDLQTREKLVATGMAVIEKLLVDRWNSGYEEKIREIMEGLWNIERWENYKHIGGSENSLQHSLRDLHLVSLFCNEERKKGSRPELGFLFNAFILHDMGEIGLGDTLYKDKTLKREREEYKRFCDLINFLSPREQKKWKYYYLGQYIRFPQEINRERFKNVSPSPLPILEELQRKYEHEGKIFDAAERIGYLLYAIHCFTKPGDRSIEPLIQVLRNQHSHLVRLTPELSSVGRYIYTSGVINWAESLLKSFEGVYLEK